MIMCEFWILLIGIAAGATGFLLATFWFQPILRYRDLKAQILSDLLFYANVIKLGDLNDEMKKRYWARVEANRRHSTDLAAAFHYLPRLYLWFLQKQGERPNLASVEMMGFSNTFEWDAAAERVDRIRGFLRFPTER